MPEPDQPRPDAGPPGDEAPLPGWVVLAGVLVLTLLLTVWSAFLVPLRVGRVPLPLWLLPLVLMVTLAARAARVAGYAGAVLPAMTWLAVTWLGFAARRSEGDLVVPPTLSGYAYLFGGVLLWAAVVLRASAADRAGQAPPATPGRRSGR